MSQIDIKSALETTLKTITPLVETVYEGMDYVPKAGVPYQRVNLIMNPPTDPCVFSDFYRESGIFQVMLCYPKAGGLNPAQVQAEKKKQEQLAKGREYARQYYLRKKAEREAAK